MHHEPILSGRFDVDILADAYDCAALTASHAACPDETSSTTSTIDEFSSMRPLHSIQLQDDCVHPFQALHKAYFLQHECLEFQARTLISHTPAGLRSALLTAPSSEPRVVTFSNIVEICICDVDEIGLPQSTKMHEGALHLWTSKPWQLHLSSIRTCHLTDRHDHGAAGAFLQSYQEPHHPQEGEPADLRDQPDHIQDLAAALHEFGDFDEATQQRHMEVISWYLHGHLHRVCRVSRSVRLTADYTTWEDEILATWRDLYDDNQAVHLHVILPDPPVAAHEQHAAQIAIVQLPVPFERAVLFSNVFHAPDAVAIQRIMKFSGSTLHLHQCLDTAEVPLQVRHRPIQGFYGWRPIPRETVAPLQLPDGASVVIHIRPEGEVLRPPADVRDSEGDRRGDRSRSPRRTERGVETTDPSADVVSFMARQPRPPAQSIPAPPVDIDFDSSSSSSGSTYASDVQSHFFHIFCLLKPMTAVRIRTDTWAAMHSNIRYALQLHRHEIQAIHIVDFRPEDLRASGTLVALIQKPYDILYGERKSIILVDVLFHSHETRDFEARRYSMAIRSDVTRRILLEEIGIQPYCAVVRQKCLVHINQHLISLAAHAPIELHHGDYVRIDVPPHPRMQVPTQTIACCLRDGHNPQDIPAIHEAAERSFEWIPVPDEDIAEEDHSLLQRPSRCLTAEQVAHTQRPENRPKLITLCDRIDPPSNILIDFSAVQWMIHEVQHIPLDIWTCWPVDFVLPTVTSGRLAELDDPCTHCLPTHVHFYVDGSRIQEQVGAGIACLIEHDNGTFLCGCMAKRVDDALHAFQGEHAAMVWALLWALQISDWCWAVHHTREFHLHFNFDALNTGYQTAGYWRTKEHRPWRILLRSLAQILQHRHHQQRLHWSHVKAHSQHPFNELVDALAKYAATHPQQVESSSTWIDWLADDTKLNRLQWIWFFEHMQQRPIDAPFMQGTNLIHFNHPIDSSSTSESVPQLPGDDETRIAWHTSRFCFTLATVNILTLSTVTKDGRLTLTKQHLLQQQFHDAGCVVVGLQETRHKRLTDPGNDLYHILGHAADSTGVDGVQLWFAKHLSFHADQRIMMKHLTIVDSAPNYLIVRLNMPHWRCIFVTGRAPHAGHEGAASEAFWHLISTRIRSYERDHLIFFLGDTNGHLGNHASDAVGLHGGTQENVPGKNFHNWLLEHQLFVPATFVDYHPGDLHSTFCAPNGEHRTRIDYIGLPASIQYDHIHSWVADDIELGAAREDHSAVLCKVSFRKISVIKKNDIFQSHA